MVNLIFIGILEAVIVLLAPESMKWQLFNFVLYVASLVFIYRKYVASHLVARSKQLEQSLNKASMEMKEAEEELSLNISRLEALSEEKDEMLENFRLEGRLIAENILRTIQDSAKRMAADAEKQIASEIGSSKKQIKFEVIRMASDKAREQLKSGLSAEADRSLRKEAVEGVA
jgi:F0F1-type ATP synthase membrane subunit b/b'